MRVRIRTRVHTAERSSTSSLTSQALQSAVPDNDPGMIVTRVRRGKGGIEVGHRIDRTNMH